ncbi:MAG: hypothetical protein WBF17_04800 [Phycisphaerae bacterium]
MADSGEAAQEKILADIVRDLTAARESLSSRGTLDDPGQVQLRDALDQLHRCVELLKHDEEPDQAARGHPSARFSEEVREQARRMDRDMAKLAQTHTGRFVAYHSGRLLGQGQTPDEAVAGLNAQQRALPFVVRWVHTDGRPEEMGGPRED